ncbi:MAG: D-cysteine desulfhydrase [Campylobacteraceae bacterium]|jgi:D-cysteine desulfhydrase|nr:D-cysteine desulfhydrase [Campylobacteraceae bacterium]
MSLQKKLDKFSRVELVNYHTPIEKLERFSKHLGRDVYIKRDDLTPIAFGGNKIRKLEFLLADALKVHADTLVTGGAIQSNHVRQTAAVAAKFGLGFWALLENPIDTKERNYLTNGNRLLLDLFGAKVKNVEELDNEQLDKTAEELKNEGKKPYVVPIGGSNALGALGYVRASLEIAHQSHQIGVDFTSVVVASGSAGTHAGLAVGLKSLLPNSELIGVTVSRKVEDQLPKVKLLSEQTAALLGIEEEIDINLWDEYFAPRYGEPNEKGLEAIKLLAELEGVLLDPVYTSKAVAGLIEGVDKNRFADSNGAILFVHTGGAPALFAYS